MHLVLTGGIRMERTKGDEVPEDVYGDPIVCPML